MTDFDSSIMITDSDTDTGTNVMTNDSMGIDTGSSQPLTRTIGKPKQDKDPNALKIASFRTKEGVWAEFSAKAESDGLTATDVLKAAMEQYLSGEYDPRVIRGISTHVKHTNNGLTRNDVLEIVSTAISTEQINSHIMMAISTLSLCSHDDVIKRIDDAIDNRVLPLIESATARVVASELLKTSTDATVLEELVKFYIEPHADRLVELEADTRSQLATVRDDLRAIADRATTEPIANPAQKLKKPDIDDVRETEPIDSPQNTNSDTPSDRVNTDALDSPTTTKPDKATEKDPNKKSWAEFFEMVGIEAMAALEAQKKQDTDTRAKQIEQGIKAATDHGLGEWIAKPAGRSFVRVDATPESPLPLFQN